MSDIRVLRWAVPVDDAEHEIGRGKVTLVATRPDPSWDALSGVVEVWTEERPPPDLSVPKRKVQVYGTASRVPPAYWHLGSCLDAGGRLARHVYEVREPTASG